jgi:hypothetical protein
LLGTAPKAAAEPVVRKLSLRFGIMRAMASYARAAASAVAQPQMW